MFRSFASLAFCVALLAYGSWILTTTSLFKTCVESQRSAEAPKTEENAPPIGLSPIYAAAIYTRCSGLVIYRYRDAATAVATTFIALFTLALWLSTSGLLKATEEAINLARAEFNATHRPRIKIHVIEITRRDVGEDTFIGASILAFNVGESAAKNVEVRGQIFMGPNFAVDVQRPIINTYTKVLSGEKFRAEIQSTINIRHVASSKSTGIPFHCIGWIAYWDQNGLRRETGFCRRAVFGSRDRWVRSGTSEYEYAY